MTRISPGSNPLTEVIFRRIAAQFFKDTGMTLPESKLHLVNSRLNKRLRALRLSDFDTYCDMIEDKSGEEERLYLISALTTNVTRFFREPHHFEHLRKEVMPVLAERVRKGGRLRIWSAGCSTGEEVFTIAMTLLSVFPEAANHNVTILGTDIDREVVRKCRIARYPQTVLNELPNYVDKRLWKQDGAWLRPGPEMQKLVRFNQHNLMRDWPMKGPFDIIMCRNVVIYFSDEAQEKLWMNFTTRLAPDGQLYLGHSERVNGPAEAQLKNVGITTYVPMARAAALTH